MAEGKDASPPPKYSRYRSVRHTHMPEPKRGPEPQPEPEPEPKPKSEPEPIPEDKVDHNVSRTKSMSRYRRSRVVSRDELNNPPPIPEVPVPSIPVARANTTKAAPRNYIPDAIDPYGGRNPTRRATDPQEPSRPFQDEKHRPRETEDERLRRKIKEFESKGASRDDLRRQALEQKEEEERNTQLRKATREQELRRAQREQALAKKEEEERNAQLKRVAEESEEQRTRRIEEENVRLLEEQKRKDLERLQRELDAAVPNPLPPPSTVMNPMKEKFSFFSRKSRKAAPPATPQGSSGPSMNSANSSDAPRVVEKIRKEEPPRRIEKLKKVEVPKFVDQPRPVEQSRSMAQIKQSGGGIGPQTDAPLSASNAGERRVLIRCKQSSINLPVTPETTPSDIIYSAANIMSQNIIPSTAILIESYTQLGLERRVRRYEHVRDVMNSWDRDTQNAFTLVNSDTPLHDTDLEVSSVPREAPGDVTVYMHHSQKPGKWNKRFITLQSSGQIFMSKRTGAKLSDKDSSTLCHLSDFDIYTPTAQQMRKTLKPPKKHCYAIKSQQKTTMFLSTENFVHFFSSEDESLAEKFYDRVQKWRSWYLVNRMGEGGKKAARQTEKQNKNGTIASRHAAPLQPEVDDTPYTIGTFSPLFEGGEGTDWEEEDEDRPRQVPFHLRHSLSVSPSAEDQRRMSRRHPPPVAYRIPQEQEEEFASAGLLGRTYSQRQRALKAANNNNDLQNNNGGFMDESALLPSRSHDSQERNNSMLSTHSASRTNNRRPATSGSGLQRDASTRIPKPLLDFTPQFKEAPQWDKTGKGHGYTAPTGIPLVEVATTPMDGLSDIPKASVVFRRDQGSRPGTRAGTGTGTGTGGNGFVGGGLVGGMERKGAGGGSLVNRGRVVAYEL